MPFIPSSLLARSTSFIASLPIQGSTDPNPMNVSGYWRVIDATQSLLSQASPWAVRSSLARITAMKSSSLYLAASSSRVQLGGRLEVLGHCRVKARGRGPGLLGRMDVHVYSLDHGVLLESNLDRAPPVDRVLLGLLSAAELRPGYPTAPRIDRLPLLPSGPGGVHSFLPRRTQSSAPAERVQRPKVQDL